MNNTHGGNTSASADPQIQQQTQLIQNMEATGSGLTRYRSAPSSYFTTLLNSTPGGDGGFDADDFAELFNPRASSPETQRIFSRFMNSSPAGTVSENSAYPNTTAAPAEQYLPSPKHEPDHAPPPLQRQRSNDYSSPASQVMYQTNNSEDNLQNKAWGSFTGSRVGQIKMESGVGSGAANSGLIRHSSSPAGLFANINIESEFGGMRGTGIRNYGGGNNANAEASFSSASRFNSQLEFSSSSKHYMDPISEISNKSLGDNSPPDDHEHRGNDQDSYISDYINSWDDSALLSDTFLEGVADKSNEGRSRPTTMLSHHLSLPKSVSAELSMEKMLQDSVPCKIRAKRGCATHPRSIAERVRRTKISERIRKLQELVPNMEKQTSTSDMLDLAVDYIKDLQRQVKTLSDSKDHCSCAAKHR